MCLHTAPYFWCHLLPQLREEAEQETAKLTPGFKKIAAKLEKFIEQNAGEQQVPLNTHFSCVCELRSL